MTSSTPSSPASASADKQAEAKQDETSPLRSRSRSTMSRKGRPKRSTCSDTSAARTAKAEEARISTPAAPAKDKAWYALRDARRLASLPQPPPATRAAGRARKPKTSAKPAVGVGGLSAQSRSQTRSRPA